jgi:uncharacterized membrane protein YkoI
MEKAVFERKCAMRAIIYRTAWILMGLGLTAGTCAAENKVDPANLPEPVLKAVEQVFPGVAIKEVEMEVEKGACIYVVEVEVSGAECELEISADGVVESIVREISAEELPAAVQSALALFADAKICEAAVEQEDGKTTYEVELKQGSQKLEIEFAEDGKILEVESSRMSKEKDADD